MAYVSLYRKYRSQTFGDLIGQDHVTRTLQNAIENGKIAHAYLFTGPRGTGKTSSARLLAKALCCEKGPTPEPCNECEICREITQGSCVDVVEMDAASDSGVDEVRERIVEVTEYRPMICRYKVFIIDEVHDLSAKAFDALLKTIEEPPAHIVFILATTEFHKVPPTIRSRCQKYEFHRASQADLVRRIEYVLGAEGAQAEPAAVAAIARMADGGYRDALTLLEQALLTTEGTITAAAVYDQLGLISDDAADEILLAMKSHDVPRLTAALAELARRGRDPRTILESLLQRLADLTHAAYQTETLNDAVREASLHETSKRIGKDAILRYRGELAEAHKAIRDVTIPRLWLESELLRIAMSAVPMAPPMHAAAPSVSPRPQPAAPSAPVAQSPAAAVRAPEPAATPAATPASAAAKPAADAPAFWPAVFEECQRVSRVLGMKVGNARVFEEGNAVVLEFAARHDYEWFEEKPKALGVLRDAVAKHKPGAELRLAVVRRERPDPTAEIADPPAEGERLKKLAAELLGAIPELSTTPIGDTEPEPE